MASFNKVILIGNLTRDPDLRYTPSGQAVCDFPIAINRRYRVNGQEREDVCFVDIVVWAKQAESCGRYLHKGASVFVDGRLRNDTWVDREGRRRTRLRVTAERVQFLSRETLKNIANGQNEQQSGASNKNTDDEMPEPPEDIYDSELETEDDVPF